jgi:hypothetical protein
MLQPCCDMVASATGEALGGSQASALMLGIMNAHPLMSEHKGMSSHVARHEQHEQEDFLVDSFPI